MISKVRKKSHKPRIRVRLTFLVHQVLPWYGEQSVPILIVAVGAWNKFILSCLSLSLIFTPPQVAFGHCWMSCLWITCRSFDGCSTLTSTHPRHADMTQDDTQSMGTVSDLYCTPQLSMPHLYSQFAEPLFGQDVIHEPSKQILRLAKASIFLHVWSQATLAEAVQISHPPHIVGEQGHMLPTHWPDWHGRRTVFWGGMRSSHTCTLGS